jgi:predicted lysophospholipase L1 biosynthesis ABC-type transport system permease subunit
MMGGAGHGGVDLDAARATLDARPDVDRWTALGITNTTIDGEPVLGIVGFDDDTDVDITLASGRLPAGTHQIALATRTAADLGVAVGDQVDLAGEGVSADRATVTGLVVLPALGPYLADRTGPGTGALLPAAALDPTLAPGMVSFVGIEVADGADPQSVADSLHDDFAAWDTLGFRTIDHTGPIRPAEITNADAMRRVPLLVGLLLGLTAAVGVGAAVVVSVRARRHDLAVLRALGFTGRQVRNSVRVQALAAMLAALAVGAPIGIVVGRVAWQSFAVQLGVGTGPSLPLAGIVLTAAAALAAAATAAAVPARLATRSHPATTLRTE